MHRLQGNNTRWVTESSLKAPRSQNSCAHMQANIYMCVWEREFNLHLQKTYITITVFQIPLDNGVSILFFALCRFLWGDCWGPFLLERDLWGRSRIDWRLRTLMGISEQYRCHKTKWANTDTHTHTKWTINNEATTIWTQKRNFDSILYPINPICNSL